MKHIYYAVALIGLATSTSAQAAGKEFTYYPNGSYTNEGRQSGRSSFLGHVELRGGYDDMTDERYGASGTVAIPFGSRFAAQFDVDYETADTDAISGTFHLGARFAQKFAVGAFVRKSRNATGTDAAFDGLVGGLEAAYQADSFTLFGSVAAGEYGDNGLTADALRLMIGAKYYVNSNFTLTAKLRSETVSAGDITGGIGDVTLRAQYRPNGTGFSLFGEYGYREIGQELAGQDYEVLDEGHRAIAGVQLHFGASTLKGEERGGRYFETFE